MKHARYILSVLLLALCLQVIFTLLVITLAGQNFADGNFASNTIFQTSRKMAVYGSPIVVEGSNKPQVIFLGSSNSGLSFRPNQVRPLLNDIQVHNMSLGGERFRALDQVVQLLYRQTDAEKRRNYLFVIGISFPLVADLPENIAKYKTSVELELLRCGIFKDTPSGLVSRVPDAYLSTALKLAWPFMVPRAVYNHVIRMLPERFWFGLVDPVNFTPEQSNNMQYTDTQRLQLIHYYHKQVFDTNGERTFQKLMHTIDRITTESGQVVIVDLPSATWLQNATPLYSAYQELKKPYLEALEKRQNIHYVSLQEGFSDDDFYDGIHPRLRVTEKIAQRIAPTIQLAIRRLER